MTNKDQITIDGSLGEGGGQILRTSLALAVITGRPLVLENIRAGRGKPGLLRQHLTAVRAAARLSKARVRGDELGSMKLEFSPGEIQSGDFEFSIGSAGSAMLVLQTILPILLRGPGATRVDLEGGTHNEFAPPFDFIERTFLPFVNRPAKLVRVNLERPGFYPAGGGLVNVMVEPGANPEPLNLLERGELKSKRARVLISNLPRHIADRELKAVQKGLGWTDLQVITPSDSRGPGNVVLLEMEYEHVRVIFAGFGRQGKSAEALTSQVIDRVRDYMKSTAAADEYLADQLLLPLALFGGGSFSAQCISLHTSTNIQVIENFLEIKFRVEQESKARWMISL